MLIFWGRFLMSEVPPYILIRWLLVIPARRLGRGTQDLDLLLVVGRPLVVAALLVDVHQLRVHLFERILDRLLQVSEALGRLFRHQELHNPLEGVDEGLLIIQQFRAVRVQPVDPKKHLNGLEVNRVDCAPEGGGSVCVARDRVAVCGGSGKFVEQERRLLEHGAARRETLVGRDAIHQRLFEGGRRLGDLGLVECSGPGCPRLGEADDARECGHLRAVGVELVRVLQRLLCLLEVPRVRVVVDGGRQAEVGHRGRLEAHRPLHRLGRVLVFLGGDLDAGHAKELLRRDVRGLHRRHHRFLVPRDDVLHRRDRTLRLVRVPPLLHEVGVRHGSHGHG
mmetsp:Transcript_51371/g.122273  ORF Transcript_51371/g.122273 Transcript_51371/m.122273 type:complete len:337 (-) Transcript_51371:1622-2632(-)